MLPLRSQPRAMLPNFKAVHTGVLQHAWPASPASAGNSCLAAVCLILAPGTQSGSQESLSKMLDACAALGDSAASMLRMAASMSSMAALLGLQGQQIWLDMEMLLGHPVVE